ncbi:hypothetical protein MMC26_003791 [Xylographa opegraphella]|nr:hypothetical protein [Xylographa opegraphella]
MPPPPSLPFHPAYCFSASPTFSTWAKLTAADVHTLTTREGFEGSNPCISLSTLFSQTRASSPVLKRSSHPAAQKIYFYLNHPIKWVRLVGVIVAFDASDYRITFCLDDSSGKIVEVTCPRDRSTGAGVPTNIVHGATVPKTPTQPPPFKGRTLSGISIDLAGFDVGSVVKVKGGIGSFRGERQLELERIIPTTTAEAAAWREAQHFHSAVLSVPWFLSPDEQRLLKEEADGTARRAEEKARRKAERETRRRKRAERAERERTAQAGRQKHDGTVHGRGQKRRVSDKENEGA